MKYIIFISGFILFFFMVFMHNPVYGAAGICGGGQVKGNYYQTQCYLDDNSSVSCTCGTFDCSGVNSSQVCKNPGTLLVENCSDYNNTSYGTCTNVGQFPCYNVGGCTWYAATPTPVACTNGSCGSTGGCATGYRYIYGSCYGIISGYSGAGCYYDSSCPQPATPTPCPSSSNTYTQCQSGNSRYLDTIKATTTCGVTSYSTIGTTDCQARCSGGYCQRGNGTSANPDACACPAATNTPIPLTNTPTPTPFNCGPTPISTYCENWNNTAPNYCTYTTMQGYNPACNQPTTYLTNQGSCCTAVGNPTPTPGCSGSGCLVGCNVACTSNGMCTTGWCNGGICDGAACRNGGIPLPCSAVCKNLNLSNTWTGSTFSNFVVGGDSPATAGFVSHTPGRAADGTPYTFLELRSSTSSNCGLKTGIQYDYSLNQGASWGTIITNAYDSTNNPLGYIHNVGTNTYQVRQYFNVNFWNLSDQPNILVRVTEHNDHGDAGPCFVKILTTPTPYPTTPPVVNTPTPTPVGPTPTPTVGPWFKLRMASYADRAPINDKLPSGTAMQPYDAGDSGQPYMNIGYDITNTTQVGVVTAPGVSTPTNQALGAGAISYSGATNLSYTYSGFNIPKFISYVKSRKQYKTITSWSDISTTDGFNIYYYNGAGAFTLTTDNAPAKHMLLIIDSPTGAATVNLNVGTAGSVYNSSRTYTLGLMVNGTLAINSAITEVNGVYIANSITTGASGTGLKVRGNFVTSSLTMSRNQNAVLNVKPSLFLIAFPNEYMDLLPYLSTSTYEWKQLQ